VAGTAKLAERGRLDAIFFADSQGKPRRRLRFYGRSGEGNSI
jgi:hypothetical protein